MVMTDPIADLLTRIRNANQAKHETVKIPASKLKLEILEVIKKEGYIKSYEVVEDKLDEKTTVQNILVTLKYTDKKERVIKGITRISKPGLRAYAKASEMPTSNGVMTDREARKQKVGGEVMAYVW